MVTPINFVKYFPVCMHPTFPRFANVHQNFNGCLTE